MLQITYIIKYHCLPEATVIFKTVKYPIIFKAGKQFKTIQSTLPPIFQIYPVSQVYCQNADSRQHPLCLDYPRWHECKKPACQEMVVRSPDGEDSPESEMASHSRILACRTHAQEAYGLQSLATKSQTGPSD